MTSPEDQNATFIELFFDLVFVFGITQIVAFLAHHLDWVGVGQAILMFWLVWWAWTQFAWALNAADTTHPKVEIATMLATIVVFFMAVAIPGAFGDHGLRFAIPYVVTRIIGLWLYGKVTRGQEESASVIVRFAILSSSGMAAVLLGGWLGGDAQLALWGLAIILDMWAASGSTQQLEGLDIEQARDQDLWGVHPEHFAERHGLIVIIALGETLIVAAVGVSSADISNSTALAALFAVLATCALWWTYFPRAKPFLEHHLASVPLDMRASTARDLYSFLHFPMLMGVVAFAVGLEIALGHPDDPMSLEQRALIGVGVLLFIGSTAVALMRAGSRRVADRAAIVAITAVAAIAVADVPPVVTLAIAFAGVFVIALLEELRAEHEHPHGASLLRPTEAGDEAA